MEGTTVGGFFKINGSFSDSRIDVRINQTGRRTNKKEWVCVCGKKNKRGSKNCSECGLSKHENTKIAREYKNCG